MGFCVRSLTREQINFANPWAKAMQSWLSLRGIPPQEASLVELQEFAHIIEKEVEMNLSNN